MARAKKINIVRRQSPQYYKVKISVNDPECLFSIKPSIEYMKVFKATNQNMAIRAAANYCNRYKEDYKGVDFKYSTTEVEPYFYVNFNAATVAEL
jgi:hypothetical protein